MRTHTRDRSTPVYVLYQLIIFSPHNYRLHSLHQELSPHTSPSKLTKNKDTYSHVVEKRIFRPDEILAPPSKKANNLLALSWIKFVRIIEVGILVLDCNTISCTTCLFRVFYFIFSVTQIHTIRLENIIKIVIFNFIYFFLQNFLFNLISLRKNL